MIRIRVKEGTVKEAILRTVCRIVTLTKKEEDLFILLLGLRKGNKIVIDKHLLALEMKVKPSTIDRYIKSLQDKTMINKDLTINPLFDIVGDTLTIVYYE